MSLTVSPKTLTAELKPVIAAIRKQTTAAKRRDMPLIAAVRIQAKDYPRASWTAAALFDPEKTLGKYPNPYASFDVLLDMDDAYALATLLDAKKIATLSVEIATIEGPKPHAWYQTYTTTGPCLVVRQPSASAGRTDIMRFKMLEV